MSYDKGVSSWDFCFLPKHSIYHDATVGFMRFLATDGIHLLYDACQFPLATNPISVALGSSRHVCMCPGKSLLCYQRTLRMTLKISWLPAISEKQFITGITLEVEGQTHYPSSTTQCSDSCAQLYRLTLWMCISAWPCSYRQCALLHPLIYLWVCPLFLRFRCYPEVRYLHIIFIVTTFEPLTHLCKFGLFIILTTKNIN